jgi:hypothetical protein
MPSPNQLIGCYPEHDRSEERRLGPRHILAIGDRKGTKFQARPARQRILQTRPAARGPWPRPRNCRLCFPRAWALFRAAPQPCRSAHVCARMGCRRLAEVIISRTVRQYRPAAAGAADPPRGGGGNLLEIVSIRGLPRLRDAEVRTHCHFGRDTGELDPRIPRSIA